MGVVILRTAVQVGAYVQYILLLAILYPGADAAASIIQETLFLRVSLQILGPTRPLRLVADCILIQYRPIS